MDAINDCLKETVPKPVTCPQIYDPAPTSTVVRWKLIGDPLEGAISSYMPSASEGTDATGPSATSPSTSVGHEAKVMGLAVMTVESAAASATDSPLFQVVKVGYLATVDVEGSNLRLKSVEPTRGHLRGQFSR